ncbi:hypothetical protein FNF27_08349 [Cafeteria roenbergensis]|uniref:Uncharacterized protein n=2 Tax=Cafeteria roenbergensis TaxID=33653 RepID=A0A5A8C6C7_CAFRO|nr:hypothetical protein FNF29_07181 [Cafeteria roenbergensis]KAA0148227.1 hypothetical protein FNF31_07453 [Cafeteria roenbergensis]KAA0158755.1 hypothetical protein FNF27_08349 [Cafeteria roenbergensis]|eukprot:KAA0147727.1 hypothetical protein FNF29_07181 [Cafeteria roenbergensis]
MAASDVDAAEVKLVMLGDTGVGKSSVAAQFVRGSFDTMQAATIGAAYLSKPFVLRGQRPIKFQIWDTAGQEKYESLAPMYYRKAGAAIVMYDLTLASSFERLRDWVRELGENGPQDIVVACVGNKLDLTGDGSAREVREDVARDFARSEGALYFEASARTGEGVTEIFEALAEEVTRRRPGALGAAAAAEEEGRVDVAPRDAAAAKGGKKGCC